MVKADTQRAYDILNEFLVSTKRRRTPERYAVLEAICNMDNRFTIDHLDEVLTEKKFKVSRATLYNCVNLFLKLGSLLKSIYKAAPPIITLLRCKALSCRFAVSVGVSPNRVIPSLQK